MGVPDDASAPSSSSSSSARSTAGSMDTAPTMLTTVAEEADEDKTDWLQEPEEGQEILRIQQQQQQTGGGAINALLEWMVRVVVAGVQGVVVLRWLLGKAIEGLAWAVE